MKRSSVFYAKIGPRLSPKLFAMRDFLTACELLSGIISRHAPPKIVYRRDSLRRVDCCRGLSAATLPRKIVCRAGFLAACGLQSGIIGRHAPPKIVCRAGFLAACGLQSGIIPRSPEDCLPAGFFAACGLQSGIIRRARKFRRKTLFLQHGRRGKGCFTPAAAAVRTPNRVFHGRTLCNFPFRALSLQYTERH